MAHRGTDELELRYATAGALAGTTNRLYADCNSGFKVRYRSVPMIQSNTERLHYNTLKGYPVSTSGGMSPAPNPRVAVPPR